MSDLIRRIGVCLATFVAVGTTIGVATPAQAIPPGCAWSLSWWVDGEQNIYASNWIYCEDPSQDQPLQVTIQRYVSPGVWATVATGRGDIAYFCNGHAYNVYRAGGDEFANTCG